MKKRVADIIFDTLADNGVEQAFCVVGGGAMYLDNALGISKRIKTIFNHHEQACAMAAEGYSRVSYGAKPAIVCVTSGPGGTNALTGVMGAYQDSIPMIVISGQVRFETTIAACPELKIRRRGEQEFDIVNSVKNMTKYAKMVTDPLSIKQEVQKAYDIAMHGRRGPVWLDIPMNVQRAEVEESDLFPVLPPPAEIHCSDKDIKKIVTAIQSARAPCILAGTAIGTADLRKSFEKFLKSIRIPVVAALAAPNALYRDHPLFFGLTGGIGNRSANFILQSSDLLVVLGCSLGFKQTSFVQENFAPNAKIIMVDVNPDEAKKPGLRVDEVVTCDLAYLFGRVVELEFKASAATGWLRHCRKLKKKFNIFEGAVGEPNNAVNSYIACEAWNAVRAEDSITVLGNNSGVTPWHSAVGCVHKKQIMALNVNCGSMGYGFPASIGAAVAAGRNVTLIDGDGSFMMNLQELQTVVYNKIPLKIVVFNNRGYGGIVSTCNVYFNGKKVGCTPDSGLSMPDFKKIATAFDIPNRYCAANKELQKSFAWLKAQKGCAMLILNQMDNNPLMPVVRARLNDDGTSSAPKPYDMFPFLEKSVLEDCLYKA